MFNLFIKQKKGQYAKLHCPRCNVIMRKIKKNDVVIDVCDKCRGMWLDDKEIDKLIKLSKTKEKSRGVKNVEKK